MLFYDFPPNSKWYWIALWTFPTLQICMSCKKYLFSCIYSLYMTLSTECAWMGQWVFQDCMLQVSLKHPVSSVFVSLGCFRFLDCDFRQRPRRINGLTWPWSHGSSDAWPSKAMSATQHNMIPFSSGWEEQNCWKMHQFSISLNPPKKTWTPKTAMTNAEPCACQHAASDIYPLLWSVLLMRRTLHHCWWTVAKYVAATSLQPRLLLQMFPCKLFAIEGTDSHNGTRQWPTPKCWKVSAFLLTLQGINISHLGKRKIIFKMQFLVGCVSSLEGNLFWDLSFISPPTLFTCSHAGALSKFQNKRMRLKQPDDETGCPFDWKRQRLFGVKVVGTNTRRSREWIPQRKYFITLWFWLFRCCNHSRGLSFQESRSAFVTFVYKPYPWAEDLERHGFTEHRNEFRDGPSACTRKCVHGYLVISWYHIHCVVCVVTFRRS